MWAQLSSALVGIWLMVAPALLEHGGRLASSNWIAGPLIASFALVAASEVTRAVRWVNSFLAAWVLLSPFVLGATGGAALASQMVSGVLVGLLSLVPGRRRHSFAGGWRSLRARAPE